MTTEKGLGTFLRPLKFLKLKKNSITAWRLFKFLILKEGLRHCFLQLFNVEKRLHYFPTALKVFNTKIGLHHCLQVFNTEKGFRHFLTTLKVFDNLKGLNHFLAAFKVFNIEKYSITSLRIIKVFILKNNSITFLWLIKLFKIAIL